MSIKKYFSGGLMLDNRNQTYQNKTQIKTHLEDVTQMETSHKAQKPQTQWRVTQVRSDRKGVEAS